MLLYYIVLSLCLSYAHVSEHFEGFEISNAGRRKIEQILTHMFKKKIFLEKEDLSLLIGEDIMPLKYHKEPLSREESQKRRQLRNIINWLIKIHFKGLTAGYEEKVINLADDEHHGFKIMLNIDGDNIVRDVYENGQAEKKGVKKGWLLKKVGHKEVEPLIFFMDWPEKVKGFTTTYRFAVPALHHITHQDLYDLTLKELMDLLGMDFFEISENYKYKQDL